jgi:hypothetical protein
MDKNLFEFIMILIIYTVVLSGAMIVLSYNILSNILDKINYT